MYTNNTYWFSVFDESDKNFTPCEDCHKPDSCISECSIANHTHEDVSKIRGEE